MRKLGLGLLVGLTVVLALLTLLPLLESDAWWIRYPDFVRLQAAIALGVLIVLAILARAWRSPIGAAALGFCVVLLAVQGSKLYPYSPLARTVAAAAETCAPGSSFKLMVSNVRRSNRDFADFQRVVREADPDLLLVLETDDWWDTQLKALDDRFPNVVPSVSKAAEYYGLHFFSKLPFASQNVVFYFDENTPTVTALVQLPAGRFRFIGLHPRPPQSFSQPTTLRDGTIAKAALDAANAAEPVVIAGDLNTVPWEKTLRESARVGALLDPRIGRGFFATYSATDPVMAWPLDHILYQNAFGLIDFRRLPFVGSDHYPIMATLCFQPGLAGQQPAPVAQADDRRDLQEAIRAAKSLDP